MTFVSAILATVAFGLFLGFGVEPAVAGSPVTIQPHRAAYKLSLGTTRGGVMGVEGGMVVDWQQECDGWTISQRMRFNVFDNDGESNDNDVSFASWEAADGLNYRFTLRTSRNGEVEEQLRGYASLEGKGGPGQAVFVEPGGVDIALPAGALFPTEHSILLIERALAGDRTVSRLVFDGATLDGAMEVNAVIGQRLADRQMVGPNIDAAADRQSWRVRMAYFKLGDPASEPDYETSLLMLDNGVAGEFVFDYREFSIRAKLDRLESLPRPKC